MRQKSDSTAGTPEKLVRDIRRATRKQYSAEEKIRIVLEGLRSPLPRDVVPSSWFMPKTALSMCPD
jgi:hypothetical protein